MFAYNIRLGLKSLRRNPVLTALMIGAIGLGIGVCMTTLNVYKLISGNPIPQRNDVLFSVQLDNWDPQRPWDDDRPEVAPYELTYRDAQAAVLASSIPDRKVIMRKSSFVLGPSDEKSEVKPYIVIGRLTLGDFFPMFDTPFEYGNGWDKDADSTAEPVVVLNKETNDKLFGGENSVGRTVRMDDIEYKVVGVLADWRPVPIFYDMNNGSINDIEEVFLPFSRGELLEKQSAGNVNCWKPEEINSYKEFLNSECVWIQAWVEVATPAREAEYKSFLDAYVAEQAKVGRFENKRPNKTRLSNVDEWLEINQVVQNDNRVLLGISFMFLAVCLLNTVGLLLAKFSSAAPVISLRRALGASRRQIFRQHLVEVSIVGIAGGLLGLGLGYLGLLGARQLDEGYERLTQMEWTVGLMALGIALFSGIVAGLYPTWRITRLQPAPYLKTQ